MNIEITPAMIEAGGMGNAQAINVYWQVAGRTTLGTTSVFNGNILGKTAIVMMSGAKLNGRALAQAAVTLDANTIRRNSQSAPALELLSYTGPAQPPAVP